MHNADLLKAYLEEVCRGRSRPWREFCATVAMGLSVAATGCGGTAEVGGVECSGNNCAQLCHDGIDNDGDGAIDCVDPDCQTNPSCPVTLYGIPF